MFENIVKVIEKELKNIYNFHGGFHYQECDPEGPSKVSKGYKEYKILSEELQQLKKIKL